MGGKGYSPECQRGTRKQQPSRKQELAMMSNSRNLVQKRSSYVCAVPLRKVNYSKVIWWRTRYSHTEIRQQRWKFIRGIRGIMLYWMINHLLEVLDVWQEREWDVHKKQENY